ncbi:MAG: hypothetical protein KBT53_05875 [Porticoccus sp.]|nr:hypothetical protein [Porticoccus sp.]MBQ0807111.1 hypothetical protein [Porticoccus sp.]
MNTFDNGTYNGPEQRKEQRRKNTDRREDIRFEPSKDDRRKNPGRRKTDADLWRQHEE